MKGIKQSINQTGRKQQGQGDDQSSNSDKEGQHQQVQEPMIGEPISSQIMQSSEAHNSSQVLQSSQPNESQGVCSELPSSDLVYDPNVGYKTGNYVIQRIKSRRWNLQRGRFQYLIKWKNYSNNSCTWQTTQDIIGQPTLRLEYLGGSSLLAVYQRTHPKTHIFDLGKNKIIKQYYHTQSNHFKYASKQLIEDMQTELQQLYRQRQEELDKKQVNKEGIVTKEGTVTKGGIVKIQQQYQTQLNRDNTQEYSMGQKGYKVKSITIQKLIYFPFQFQMKILIHQNRNPDNRKLITCNQMMLIYPQAGIICYKAKIAFIQRWKSENLPSN